MRLKWDGDRSTDGHYMLQSSSIYHGPGVPRETEISVFYSPAGGAPYPVRVGITGGRRDAKVCAQQHADSL